MTFSTDSMCKMPEWPHPTVLWTMHYFLLYFKGKLSWACWEAKYTEDMNYSSDCKGRIHEGSWETWKPANLSSAGLVIWISAGQDASTPSFEALQCFYRVENNTKRNLLVFINEIRDVVAVQVVNVQGYRKQQEQENTPSVRRLLPAAWGKRGPVFWWASSCC